LCNVLWFIFRHGHLWGTSSSQPWHRWIALLEQTLGWSCCVCHVSSSQPRHQHSRLPQLTTVLVSSKHPSISIYLLSINPSIHLSTSVHPSIHPSMRDGWGFVGWGLRNIWEFVGWGLRNGWGFIGWGLMNGWG